MGNGGGSAGKGTGTIDGFVGKFDLYASQLPAFNLNGGQKVPSVTGGIASLLLIQIMITYGALKFSHMLSKHNP